MSITGGALDGLEIKTIINPLTSLDEKTYISYVESSHDYTVTNYTANSISNSSITWNINPASGVVIMRDFRISLPFTLTLNAAVAGSGDLYVANYSGVRAWAIAQLINNATLSINGQATSSNLSNLIYGLWCAVGEEEKTYYTNDGYLDNYQQYDAASASATNNPLAKYNSNCFSQQLSRGALNDSFTVAPGASGTTFTVSGTLYGSIPLLSPLVSGPAANTSKGLFNVQTLQLTLSLNTASNFTPIWQNMSFATSPVGGVVTSSSLTIGANTQLAITTLTPPMLPPKGMVSTYSYMQLTPYPTTGGSLTTLASQTLTSNVISLDCVPSKLYVWARLSDAYRKYSTTDTFCSISNVSVTYNNRSSVLSSLNQWDLFRMSVENGINQSWMQFSKNMGSVLCIDISKNIGVPMHEAPGVRRKTTLQVQCTFRNEGTATMSGVTLYVVPVLPGWLQIAEGTAQFGVGVVTEDELRNSEPSRYNLAAYNRAMQQNSLFSNVGGSFLSDVADAGKWALNVAAPIVGQYAVRALLGASIGGKKTKKVKKSKSYKHRGKSRGKGYVDVEHLSNSELRDRLHGLGIHSDGEESEESESDT